MRLAFTQSLAFTIQHRSLRSWCVKETDESTTLDEIPQLLRCSMVQTIFHLFTDPDPDQIQDEITESFILI